MLAIRGFVIMWNAQRKVKYLMFDTFALDINHSACPIMKMPRLFAMNHGCLVKTAFTSFRGVKKVTNASLKVKIFDHVSDEILGQKGNFHGC